MEKPIQVNNGVLPRNKIREQARDQDMNWTGYSYTMVFIVAGMAFGGLCLLYHGLGSFFQWLAKII
ncbi:MAG: hypothetical protein WCF94_01650 [bacterium]